MSFRLLALFLLMPLLFACTAHGAAPDGAYLRTEFSGGALSNVIYVFRDGRVAYAAGGDLEAFDFDAHAAATPKNSGRYVRSGDTLRITWGDGSVQESALRPDSSGGGFQFHGAPFAPIVRITDPSRLRGRYYGGASYGGVSSAFDLYFDGQGGFRSGMTGSIASSGQSSEVSALSQRDASGRYQLSGARLGLIAGNDSKQHWAYEVPTSTPEVVSLLILDGIVMTHDGG